MHTRDDSWPVAPAATWLGACNVPMLGDRLTFAQQDHRRKNEVDADMYNDRQPDHDAISFRKVQYQDVGANAELDQGHAIEVEKLTKPQPFEVLL